MREQLKDILLLVLVEIICTVIMALGQIYDIQLLRGLGNGIIAAALSIYGYRGGRRDSLKKCENCGAKMNESEDL